MFLHEREHTMPELERWGSVEDACRVGKFGKGRLYQFIHDGIVEARKDGRRTYINLDTVRNRFERLPVAELKPLKNRPEQFRDRSKPRRRRQVEAAE
jgi:hypothetical protein